MSGIYIFKPLVNDEGKGKTESALGSQPVAHEQFVIQSARKIECLTLLIRSTVDHSGLGLMALDQSRAGDTK